MSLARIPPVLFTGAGGKGNSAAVFMIPCGRSGAKQALVLAFDCKRRVSD